MRAIKGIYEDGKIKLLEPIKSKRAKLSIIIEDIIDENNSTENSEDEIFNWNPDKELLTNLTADTIEEWKSEEEDKIWK